jgi:hypothetical protein
MQSFAASSLAASVSWKPKLILIFFGRKRFARIVELVSLLVSHPGDSDTDQHRWNHENQNSAAKGGNHARSGARRSTPPLFFGRNKQLHSLKRNGSPVEKTKPLVGLGLEQEIDRLRFRSRDRHFLRLIAVGLVVRRDGVFARRKIR